MDVREEPVPYFHQEWKHAQEATGKSHPELGCIWHPHTPDQESHLFPIPFGIILWQRWVDSFGELVGSNDIGSLASIK